MRILIAYATTDGHTRKLAEFAGQRLSREGHEVLLHDCADPEAPDPAEFDDVILAGSIHLGRFQPALVAYARAHAASLNARPSALIAVSLSAAGDHPEDREGLDRCTEHLLSETGWRPSAIHHAAGAFMFTRYGWLKRMLLNRIARRRGLTLDTSKDHDLTAYEALIRFLRELVAEKFDSGQESNENPTTHVMANR